MKTLFFKSNILHIRTNEGEFEVSNPEVKVRGRIGQDVTARTLVDLIGRSEWLGDVEFVHQIMGNMDAKKWETTHAYMYSKFPEDRRRIVAHLLPKECGSDYKEFEGKDLHIVTPESSEPHEKYLRFEKDL